MDIEKFAAKVKEALAGLQTQMAQLTERVKKLEDDLARLTKEDEDNDW